MNTIWLSAVIAFCSTTIDDFAVLLIFYSRAKSMPNKTAGYLRVILGQTLGFTIVVIISLFGMILGTFFSQEYINIIGIIPLYLGLQKLYEILEDEQFFSKWYSCCCFTRPSLSGYTSVPDVEDGNKQPSIIHLGVPTQGSENSESSRPTSSPRSPRLTKRRESVDHVQHGDPLPEPENQYTLRFKQFAESILHPFTIEVTLYALMFSSDNLGIYTALFATMPASEIVLVCAMLYVLLFVSAILAMIVTQVCICMYVCIYIDSLLSNQWLWFYPFILYSLHCLCFIERLNKRVVRKECSLRGPPSANLLGRLHVVGQRLVAVSQEKC